MTDVEDMPEHANTNEELNRESENEEDLVATRNPEELHLSMLEHFFSKNLKRKSTSNKKCMGGNLKHQMKFL